MPGWWLLTAKLSHARVANLRSPLLLQTTSGESSVSQISPTARRAKKSSRSLKTWVAPDVLVNNAGVLQRGPFLEVTEHDFDVLMGINVKAAYFVAQSAASQMVGLQRGGSIINLSSLAGFRGSSGLPTTARRKARSDC